MRQYESPRICFEELVLYESIAATCWGGDSVTFDVQGDTYGQISTTLPNGCGNMADFDVKTWVKNGYFGGNETQYNEWWNTYINNSSNLANTDDNYIQWFTVIKNGKS